ncbi:hypothetical protein ZTR_10492 [Talaromyces verruculosus]|nr:hypothetical protein ZTR_10492 [Talaromyces verruculosus]
MPTISPIWFQLTNDHDRVSFHSYRRLAELLHQDRFPRITVHPSLTCFLGRHRKDCALERIFLGQQTPSTGAWNLQVDPRTASASNPCLVVDGDPLLRLADADQESNEGNDGATSRPVEWATARMPHLLDAVLARLLFPFCDLICLFVDDLGGDAGVCTLLQSWTAFGCTATTTRHRPRLLLISESDEGALSHIKHDPDAGNAGFFSSVTYLHLPVRLEPIDDDAYQPLSSAITEELEQSQLTRQQTRSCLSGSHLNALYESAVQHVCTTAEEPFNIIRACRQHRPIPTSLTDHFRVFLSLSPPMPRLIALSVIASSILMDAYREEMHDFHPADMFDALYRSHCESALSCSEDPSLMREECEHIKLRLCALDEEKIQHQQPASQIHRHTLDQHRSRWRTVHSHSICLACLVRRPQHVLACRHSICDFCAGMWGTRLHGWEYGYLLKSCPLCRQSMVVRVRSLPPTAAVRAVAIDGGGVRGVIPLRQTCEMQSTLGPHCPLRDCVDVSFGTSSGRGSHQFRFVSAGKTASRVASDLLPPDVQFLRNRGEREEITKTASWDAHDRTGSNSLPVSQQSANVGPAISVVSGRSGDQHSPGAEQSSLVLEDQPRVVFDSQYDGRALQALYRRHYGDRRMFDMRTSWSGIKVAVIAMAELPVLLTNYHVHRPRPLNGGYIPVLRSTPDQGFRIWQCACATSAVPTLLPPIFLPGLGECWDGALSHNNPSAVCRQEIECLWPWEPPLGVLLSFGTGYCHNAVRPCATPSRSRPRFRIFRRSLVRLFRTLMMSMDGEAAWTLFFRHADDGLRSRLQRLNTILSGPEPTIDAVDRMPSMSEMVWEQGLGPGGFRALCLLLAASLFFTVEKLTRREPGGYFCLGAIRCRLPGMQFLSTMKHLGWTLRGFFRDGHLMEGDLRDPVCPQCGRLVVPVQFSVPDLQHRVVLSVELHARQLFPIGGFPHPLDWFLQRQGIQAVFGGCDESVNRQVCPQCQDRIDSIPCTPDA